MPSPSQDPAPPSGPLWDSVARRAPRRRTSPRVRFIDAAMRAIVTIGGLGVIAAVLGIMVYLTLKVLPLFERGTLTEISTARRLPAPPAYFADLAFVTADDDGKHAVALTSRCTLITLDPPSEIAIACQPTLPSETTVLHLSTLTLAREFAAALSDGSVRTGRVTFAGSDAAPALEFSPQITLPESGAGIALLDLTTSGSTQILALARSDGSGLVNRISTSRPLGGGKPTLKVSSTPFQLRNYSPGNSPTWLFIEGEGRGLFAVHEDGAIDRYALEPEGNQYTFAERAALTTGQRIRSAAMLAGHNTLIVGRNDGIVQGLFTVPAPASPTSDHRVLIAAHTFNPPESSPGAAITALTPSPTDRCFAALSAAGRLTIYHMTSHKLVAETQTSAALPDDGATAEFPALLAFSSRRDTLLHLSDSALHTFAFSPKSPETSLHSLFGKVHYEGAPAPAYVWQSSPSDDTGEAKYSLIPLIFGTFKATLYAMLFATPIAILAAIYTSEMLHPRIRNRVKPAIEMMASLPSVVLGFVAATVVAPLAAHLLAPVLVAFFIIPVSALFAAYLWQALPVRITARLRSSTHLALVALVVALSTLASYFVAGLMERTLFTRDPAAPLVPTTLRAWLDSTSGSPWPGWWLLLLPASTILISLLRARLLDDPITRRLGIRTGAPAAALQLAKFLLTLAAAFALAALLASLLTLIGLDARSSILGPFNQRNTLVVAIVMGFAIIPLIYTLSEDALAAVPGQLRSASLGCGATRWQTAIRVVLPIAGSGVFAACMIGLGRAAGETMIVLMATGNTPITSWSIFDGLRTLAANIAVELPEAPQNSTHYRILFLGGLCLLALTFAVNTAAELVRQRYRKRAAAL
ncbi:hypothetical protein BH11PLA1_BH11PLA1_11130 [soil metagenome]